MTAAAPVPMTGRGERKSLPVDLGDGPFAVATRGLRKHYGDVAALDGLDLQVPEGAVYVLVGPNGAGKSTLLRLLMNLVHPDGGDVSVLGLAPGRNGPEIRAGVGYVPEGHDFGYPWMTVGRLFAHYAAYYPTWDHGYADRLAREYEIDRSRKCGALSKGQRRRVQLLLALATRPPLLLLDEPTDGLDHVVRDRTLSLLSEHLSDAPTTVLMSTHRVYEVEQLVDHVGVLSNGRLLGQLPREALQRNLCRYAIEVPDGWSAPAVVEGDVVRRAGRGRDQDWTVWGEPEAIRAALAGSGVTVRSVVPLNVDEAATALLSGGESA